MTKAVVLAAGRGTRMKELTADRPKPMLEINGKPLIEHVLERLRAAGFTRALVVTGYRAESIEQHLANYRMDIEFVRQEPQDGTATGALLARGFAGGDPFLFTFGDILATPEDYSGIAARLESEGGASAAVGVKWVEDPWRGAAVYEESGRVTRIVEKPPPGTSGTHWNSAGLYTFRPEVFEELARVERSPRGEYELTSAVEALLAGGRRLLLYALQGGWKDVGRPEDLDAARSLF